MMVKTNMVEAFGLAWIEDDRTTTLRIIAAIEKGEGISLDTSERLRGASRMRTNWKGEVNRELERKTIRKEDTPKKKRISRDPNNLGVKSDRIMKGEHQWDFLKVVSVYTCNGHNMRCLFNIAPKVKVVCAYGIVAEWEKWKIRMQ